MNNKICVFFANKLLLIIIIFAAAILSLNLAKPFIGHHDFMGAFEGSKAKNYVKYGFVNLKLGAVPGLVRGPIRDNRSYSTHYLPLLPILISISYSIFGISEWATRLVPALFSLLGVIALFLICRNIWDKKVAFIASLIYIFTPMFIYFGSLPAPDIPVLSMILISIYFYLQFLESQNKTHLLALSTAIFIGGFFAWTIFYVAFAMVIHSLIVAKFRLVILLPLLISVSTVFLLLLHSYILTGSFISDGTLSTIKFRLIDSNLSFGGVKFTLINYIKQEISWGQAFYTRVLLILSALYVLFNLNLKNNNQKATLALLLLVGIAHPIIFSRYVFIHDFLNIYILPFIAITSALGLLMLTKNLSKVGVNRLGVTIFITFILFLFFTERLNFTTALLETSENSKGKQVAQVLNRLQQKPDEVAVISSRFESFYGVFAKYYSKYPYVALDENILKSEKDIHNYSYIITFDQDISSKKQYRKMIQTYSYEKIEDLTIFKIRE